MALQGTNISASTLNGAINNSVTSLDVTSAASFPASGTFWIRIDDEIIKVTGVSTNTFTVVRGESGGGASAAASHSDGATVTGVLTSQAITQLRADITRWGTYSTFSGLTDMKSGDVFYFDGTDTPYTSAIYNGSSWDMYYRGYKCTPLDSSGWTWDNQESTAVSQTGGTALYTCAHNIGSGQMAMHYTTVTPPFTVEALILPMVLFTTGEVGVALRQSSDGKIRNFAFTQTPSVYVNNWTTSTSFSAGLSTVTSEGILGADALFMQMSDDNSSTRRFKMSKTPAHWLEFYNDGRTTFLTADRAGVSMLSQNTSPFAFFVLSWKVS